MTTTPRVTPFLIYLLPVVGWLAGLLLLRRNAIALYHTCQALALTLGVLFVPALWAVAGWGVAWIPLVGPVLTIASFSIVIAAIPTFIIVWIMGMLHALRGQTMPLPLVGAWGEAIFRRLVLRGDAIPTADAA